MDGDSKVPEHFALLNLCMGIHNLRNISRSFNGCFLCTGPVNESLGAKVENTSHRAPHDYTVMQQVDINMVSQSDVVAKWVQTVGRQDLGELPISRSSNADKVYLDFLVTWGGLNLVLVTGVFEDTESTVGAVLISLVELSINTV